MSKDRLTDRERAEVSHWKGWLESGGTSLAHAPMAIKPLLEIIERIAPEKDRP